MSADRILAILVILVLIYWMTKVSPMPFARALPFAAVFGLRNSAGLVRNGRETDSRVSDRRAADGVDADSDRVGRLYDGTDRRDGDDAAMAECRVSHSRGRGGHHRLVVSVFDRRRQRLRDRCWWGSALRRCEWRWRVSF